MTVEEGDLIGLESKFSSIRSSTDALLLALVQTSASFMTPDAVDSVIGQMIRGVMKNYLEARNLYYVLVKGSQINPDYVSDDLAKQEPAKALHIVRSNCDAVIGVIRFRLKHVVPQEALRNQIKGIEDENRNLYKHLEHAIREYEEGHYISSTLVSCKAIAYSLDQLPGKTDEEKAALLVQQGLIDRKLETDYLKSSRRARAFFSHDIGAIPEPQEALELLASAVNFSLLLLKANNIQKGKSKV